MRTSAYRDLWRLPGVPWQAISALLAQVTQGAAGVGIILVVREHSGSLPLAGGVLGAFAVSVGIVRPAQGRFIDRHGVRVLMAACGVVHAAALAGIVVLTGASAPGITLIVLGALAGLALPPLSPTMRVLWGALASEAERTAAFSLVYLTQQLSVLTGPLLLAAVIAVDGPSAALIAVAVARVPADVRGARRASARARGRVLTRRLAAPIAVGGLTGAAIGALEVGCPTLAIAHRDPAAGGLLIGAMSIGGIAGALLYGGRRWTSSPAARLIALLCALAAVLALTVPASSLLLVGTALMLAGIALNPVLTTISLLVDDAVRSDRAAEAFGWMSTGVAGGTGAASAIAAALTRPGHPATAFLLAAVAAAAAALLAVAIRGQAQGRVS
jgi:MFS family permease